MVVAREHSKVGTFEVRAMFEFRCEVVRFGMADSNLSWQQLSRCIGNFLSEACTSESMHSFPSSTLKCCFCAQKIALD